MRGRFVRRVVRFLFLIFLASCISLALSLSASSRVSWAQESESISLVQQGIQVYRQGQFLEAIALWQNALGAHSETGTPGNRAIILENLARAYQQTGRFSEALTLWQEALALYSSINATEKFAPVRTEQAQIYSALGQPREAIVLLCGEPVGDTCAPGTAVELAMAQGNLRIQAAALGSLGEAYRAIQAYEQALYYSERQGLAIAQQQADSQLLALLHSSIGMTYSQQARDGYLRANAAAQRSANSSAQGLYQAAWHSDQKAKRHLKKSLSLFRERGQIPGQEKALLALFDVLSRSGETPEAKQVFEQAFSLWEALPNNREKVSVAIRLAKRPQPIVAAGSDNGAPISVIDSRSSRTLCRDIGTDDRRQKRLREAVDLSIALDNKRLQSFAMGELGHLYECRQAYQTALDYTQKARLIANDAFAAVDGLHLWQWQAGRIYQALNQLPKAIQAYEQATQTLETVRSQILATSKSLQFDFRDEITPVYRELAALQLAMIPPAQSTDSVSLAGQSFSKVLGNIDSLQLAELQNYLGSDCLVTAAPQRLDESTHTAGRDSSQPSQSPLGESAALVNTIVLPDKTAVVLTLPNGVRYLNWIEENEATLHQTTLELLNDLKDWGERDFDTQPLKQMYDRLLRPFEQVLSENTQIDTLIFIQDGIFRSLPMAALYTGSEYLVERYAIATVPFLSLSNLEPTDTSNLQALFVGVTQAAQVNGETFGALSFVATEAAKVKAQLPSTTLLLDQNLPQSSLKKPLKAALQQSQYSVLHIATHGKFEADADKSFLVLGKESTITLGELDRLIREFSPNTEPLDLIVLSACQTATGDDRAALGLAGVTIRAGATSALATLWSVSDATTATLVSEFYRGLVEDKLPKAKALQQAQKQIIANVGRQRSPGLWSPFTLVGNWQ